MAELVITMICVEFHLVPVVVRLNSSRGSFCLFVDLCSHALLVINANDTPMIAYVKLYSNVLEQRNYSM